MTTIIKIRDEQYHEPKQGDVFEHKRRSGLYIYTRTNLGDQELFRFTNLNSGESIDLSTEKEDLIYKGNILEVRTSL